MKLREKITALVMAASMLLSVAPAAFAAEDAQAEEAVTAAAEPKGKELDFFDHVVVGNKVKSDPNGYVNRSEFSAIISNMLGLVEYNEEAPAEGEEPTKLYSDVDSTHIFYNEIAAAASGGYMGAISDNVFAPEQNVTYITAVKALVDMMGYNVRVTNAGGYPDGYIAVAQSIGLTKGMSKGFDEELLQKDIAKLIYNALDVRVQSSEFKDGGATVKNSDETFLTEILHLDRIKGTVTDNGLTGLYGATQVDEDEIIIGGYKMTIGPRAQDARDLLGRAVTAYVTNEDEDDRVLVYALLSGKDSTVTFDALDFLSFTPEQIRYRVDGRATTKKLDSAATFIVNNGFEKYFDEATFKNIEYGKITLVMEGSVVKYIIAEDHKFMHVNKIANDTSSDPKKIFYSSILSTNRTRSSLALKDYETVIIKDENGAEVNPANISVGSVLDIMANDPVVAITVVTRTVDEYTVSNTSEDDDNGYTYITDGETSYRLLKELSDSAYTIKPKKGEVVTMYLGADDLVVYMESKKSELGVYNGFMYRAKYDDDAESYLVCMYKVNGLLGEYPLKDKVKVIDQDGNKSTKTKEAAYNVILKDYTGFIQVKTDENDNVKEITIPRKMPAAGVKDILTSSDRATKEGSLYTIYDGSGWSSERGYDGKWFYDGNTIFINTPLELRDTGKYQTLRQNDATTMFEANRQRTYTAYSTKPNSVKADYVVFHTTTESAEVTGGNDYGMTVVEKIETVLNSDDEVIERLTGTKVYGGKTAETKRVEYYSTIITESDGSTHSSFAQIKDTAHVLDQNADRYDIKPGDIIHCKADMSGNVSACDLVWRPSLDNPGSSSGKKGYLAGVTEAKNVAGTGNTNPYDINTDGSLMSKAQTGWDGKSALRIGFGSVISTESYFINLTTCDLTDPSRSLASVTEEYLTCPTYLGQLVIANYDENGDVTSYVGSINDVKTYEQVGNDCSRILFTSHWGVYGGAIIINGGDY